MSTITTPTLTARELRKAAMKDGAAAPAVTVPAVPTYPLWTMEDVAVYLQTSYGAVRNMRMRKLLPLAIKRGRTVRWAPETIVRWAESMTEVTTEDAA